MKEKHPFIVSITIILFLLGSLASLDYIGTSSRVYRESFTIFEDDVPIFITKNTTDAYVLWKKAGFRGRTILHMGKYLHFIPVETDTSYNFIRKSVPNKADIMKGFESHLSYKNFLWLAMEENIAREIYYVLPPEIFKKKIEAHKKNSETFSESEIVTNYLGSKKVMTDHVPHLRESVLLNIDASFFDTFDLNGVVGMLKSAGLRVDLITFCRAEDNPDVTDLERTRLEEAARVLLQKIKK